MIGFLRGRVLALSPDRLLLDVAGVGYTVRIALPTFYELDRLAASGGERPAAELYVHTHVREDALELFGFAREVELRTFLLLISLAGVGPRLAQVILSGMAPDELLPALARGDVARLLRIPGVGKKTAERMVLELRDKAQQLARQQPAEQTAAASTQDDVVQALVHLGYKPVEAERAARAVFDETPAASLQHALRLALKRLSRL